MDKFKYELMRQLEREYYADREKRDDPWRDLKYLGVRIVLVGLLVVVVLSIWPW